MKSVFFNLRSYTRQFANNWTLIHLCLRRKNSNRKKRTMHFDNPVYRKTTEETLTLEPEPKYDHNPGNGVKSGNAYVLVSVDEFILMPKAILK